ncbi:MAG: bacillithiol biosynthesis cysteine-adding enzyme BshC [Gemmatimonadales bacterium]
MTLPIIDTPIGAPARPAAPRPEPWNRVLEAALIPSSGTERLVARLREPGAVVVTTGQQPGLLTGPAYAITKALSARGMALALETQWKRPVVPVYWIPGDDHDWHEVNHVSWLGADGDLLSVALPERPADAALTPMWRQPLGPEVLPALERFEQSFPSTPERATTVEWLHRHYQPEATVAGAYGAALAELLAPFGVLCLDSSHRVVKQASSQLLLQALEQSVALERELTTLATSLTAAGNDPGVTIGEGGTPVFLDGVLGRDRLLRSDSTGTFVLRRQHATIGLEEVRRIAAEEPTRLSGNVLLRPVLESAVLPTAAYLAGPAELRYLALTPPLYRHLGVPRQLPVPRWSGLLVEPRVSRVLRKYGITVEDLLADGGLEGRIARQALPEGTDAAFRRLRETIREGYGPVIEAAKVVDPTLERPAESARGQALFMLEELEKKLVQHARKRESTELAQIARARLSVRPGGKPQERVLSMAGFLARYGNGILEELAAHIARWYA